MAADWRNIVASCGGMDNELVGLRLDGTVLSTAEGIFDIIPDFSGSAFWLTAEFMDDGDDEMRYDVHYNSLVDVVYAELGPGHTVYDHMWGSCIYSSRSKTMA